MSKHILFFGLGLAALTLAVPLSGCATLQDVVAPATPTQITTLGEAEQAATLVTQAADTYVVTTNPTQANLVQIQELSNAVHAALVDLETAQAAGKSLTFDSFNAALQAFNAYTAATAPPSAVATATSTNAGTGS